MSKPEGGPPQSSKIETGGDLADAGQQASTPPAAAILASMTEGLIVGDRAGSVTDMNAAALRLYGYGSVEEARRHLQEFPDTFELRFADGSVLPAAERPFARALRGETFTNYQLRVRRRDTGAEWWGNYGGTLVRDAAGGPLLVIVTVYDVSALKRAEQEMHYLTAHARCLLWHGTVTLFEDGGFWWQTQVFDDAAAQTFCPLDILPEESYTDAWYRHRLPEGQQHTDATATAAFTAGQPHYSTEFGCRGRDGAVRWFSEQVHIEPLSGEHAHLDPRIVQRWRVVGVAVDITQHKQAQEALRDSTDELRAVHQETVEILESISDGFYAVDNHFRFTYINRQAEQMWGMRREELLGQNLWEAFPRSVGTPIQEHLLRAARERRASRLEMWSPPLGRWIDVNVYPGVRGLCVYFRDITERKHAEEALREATVRQRTFLRDMLASVTEGKLRLCDTPDDLPPRLSSTGPPLRLSISEGIRELRHRTQEAAMAQGFPDDRWQDLITAVGEAAMNAVVHAGGGEGRVCGDGRDTVQVWIRDQGEGIAVEHLPRATLKKGYTTAGTLGHGMKMMLQTADRLWLLTGPTGTIVVLEQDRIAPVLIWQ